MFYNHRGRMTWEEMSSIMFSKLLFQRSPNKLEVQFHKESKLVFVPWLYSMCLLLYPSTPLGGRAFECNLRKGPRRAEVHTACDWISIRPSGCKGPQELGDPRIRSQKNSHHQAKPLILTRSFTLSTEQQIWYCLSPVPHP